jgi:predicted enzyme related to lactoylglutathione lyase
MFTADRDTLLRVSRRLGRPKPSGTEPLCATFWFKVKSHERTLKMANPVRWFEIYVSDMGRAKKFYESMLGTKLDKLPDPGPGVSEMLTFPMEEMGTGSTGALVRMKDGPGPGAGVIIYFASEDCAVEARRAADSGGKIVKDKFAIGQYGYIAHVTDPDGNMIGLHSMK